MKLHETKGLIDIYVRFFRMAERRIAEKTGRGVICFISNYSWLDGLSFAGMRERYLEAFDVVRIDNLNGDKYKTGKTTPEDSPDPSIFSTAGDPVGIQVGTAVTDIGAQARPQACRGSRISASVGTGEASPTWTATAEVPAGELYDSISPDLGTWIAICTNDGQQVLAGLALTD